MSRRVYVAGTGVISAIGNNIAETLDSFRHSRSGISRIENLTTAYRETLPAGEIKLSNRQLAEKNNISPDFSRTAILGIHAAREACNTAGLEHFSGWRKGLVSATTVGGMDLTEGFFSFFHDDPSSGRLRNVVDHECGRTAERIADVLKIRDYITTINTACSSSVNSIIFGCRLIEAGMLDIVVAGGADALTRFTLNGFNSLMILDKNPCRPFDKNRGGLNLGEGAGFVVLVSDRVAEQEGIGKEIFVSGYANTNDAYHQTASSPDGRGSYAAMTEALAMSSLDSRAIDYINLHGTGTVNNDQSEGAAIARLFGDTIPKLSSTKSFTGHTLGACGGLEAAFSVMALKHGCVFPNLRFQTRMEDTPVVPQADFESGLNLRNVMSNSFGFGGNCSSIIFSKS